MTYALESTWQSPIPGNVGGGSHMIIDEDFNSSPGIAILNASNLGLGQWVTAPATATAVDAREDGGAVTIAFNASETSLYPGVSGFAIADSRPLRFEARVKLTALTGVLAVGVWISNDHAIASAPTDGAYFLSTVTTGVVNAVLRKSNATAYSKASVDTLVAATYVRFGLEFLGLNRTNFYIDGEKVASYADVPAAGTVVSPQITIQTASTFTVDYIRCWQPKA